MLLVANAENNQGGQALWIGNDAPSVHALPLQFPQQKAPHMLIADTRDQRRFQAQPRSSGCNVGRGATDILVEGCHVFEKAANLRAIQVHRRSANRYQVEPLHCCPPSVFSYCCMAAHETRHIAVIPFLIKMDLLFYFNRKMECAGKGQSLCRSVPTATASAIARQSVAESDRNAPKSTSETRSVCLADLLMGLTKVSVIPTTSIPRAATASAMATVSGE